MTETTTIIERRREPAHSVKAAVTARHAHLPAAGTGKKHAKIRDSGNAGGAQDRPALASSTATRRSISARTWSSRSSPEPSWRSAGHRFEPQHRGLIERAGEQPELELVERIERPAAVFDRAAPAFHRVFDALQRNQRVDSAQGAQSHGRALRLRAPQPRPARSSPPDARRAAARATWPVPFGSVRKRA